MQKSHLDAWLLYEFFARGFFEHEPIFLRILFFSIVCSLGGFLRRLTMGVAMDGEAETFLMLDSSFILLAILTFQ
jgi:hypothetical protein